jgi:hypothetical protein
VSAGAQPHRGLGKLPVAVVLGLAGGVLPGCATPAGEGHTTQAALGRVTEVAAATSSMPSEPQARAGIGMGVGSGGAIGGISLGLVFGGDRASGSPVVVLTLDDGLRRLVRTRAEVHLGDCVAVMTSPERVLQTAWQDGEATLVPAQGCR